MINLDDKSIIFTLNGELLITSKGSELAFADFGIENGNFPFKVTWFLEDKTVQEAEKLVCHNDSES